MTVKRYADSVYVSARERVNKRSHTLIEGAPGVEHVTTSCGGYSTGVRFADTYDAEEVAARMVIIRAEQAGVDPADVALQGDIAKETRVEVLRTLHKEAALRGAEATLRLRQAQEDARQSAERANWLWKKIEEEIRQQEA
jgi:hypothetical protein